MCNGNRVGTFTASVLMLESSSKGGEAEQPSLGLVALQ